MAGKAALAVFEGGEKGLELDGEGLEDNLLTGRISLQASARLTYPEFKLESKSLELEMSDLSFKANQVRLEISPDFFRPAVSFFKKDRPLTAAGVEASGNRERIDLNGQTVLRQEENVFLAGRASVDRETGMIALSDGIKANLAYRQAGSKIKRAELRAKELSLFPSSLALEARGEVTFLSAEFKLQSGRLVFYFEKENSDELTRLEADGPVGLDWHDYEFNSKEAIYRPAEEVFVFSGRAKLKDKEGNLVEADKLTLFTLDDKITVENQGKKRSVTILRRGK
jgi:lipopolysaccharide export system protein LptA